jgi:hypothetical protein
MSSRINELHSLVDDITALIDRAASSELHMPVLLLKMVLLDINATIEELTGEQPDQCAGPSRAKAKDAG